MFFVVSFALGGSLVFSGFDRAVGVLFASDAAIELSCVLVWFVLADGLAGTLLFPNQDGDVTWFATHSHGLVLLMLPVIGVLAFGAATRSALSGERAGATVVIVIGAAIATGLNMLIFGWLVKEGVGYSAASGEYTPVATTVRDQWGLTTAPGPSLGRELRSAVYRVAFSGEAIAGTLVAAIATPVVLVLVSRTRSHSHSTVLY